jgi:hypothetical protein
MIPGTVLLTLLLLVAGFASPPPGETQLAFRRPPSVRTAEEGRLPSSLPVSNRTRLSSGPSRQGASVRQGRATAAMQAPPCARLAPPSDAGEVGPDARTQAPRLRGSVTAGRAPPVLLAS